MSYAILISIETDGGGEVGYIDITLINGFRFLFISMVFTVMTLKRPHDF